MMKPRKASNETSRSVVAVERELDLRRVRDSRSSLGFFPVLTSAMELTVEADGEFRFIGASSENTGSLPFPAVEGGAVGVV
jgi:hypothetical protein